MPSLEHNNEVKGESLDLIRYIDDNFEGPPLFPDVRSSQVPICAHSSCGVYKSSYKHFYHALLLLVAGGLSGCACSGFRNS